tara:strand:+ start:2818 stop:3558 length:741 start_codon:yes stop_codon:yes gene_type:complete
MQATLLFFLVVLAASISADVTNARAEEPMTISGPAKVVSSEVVMVDNKFVRLVGYDAPSKGERCDLGSEVRKWVSRTSGDGAGIVIDGTKAHKQLVNLAGKGGLFCFVTPVKMKTPPPLPGDKFIQLYETSEVAFSGVCYRKFAGSFTCKSNLWLECNPSNGDRSINEEMIALGYGGFSRPFRYPPVNHPHIEDAKKSAVSQGLPLAIARDKSQAICMSFAKYDVKRRDELPLPPNLDLNDLMDSK